MAIERNVTFLIGANAKQFKNQLDDAQKNMRRFGRKMERIGSSMTRNITAPIVALGGASLKAAADFESMQKSLSVLNGSAEEGARVFQRLKDLASGTPFQLADLTKAQQTLQGFGMTADDAYTSIKRIGDIAAISGGDVQSIAIAFGQAAAEGKLLSRDIRQLINQQVPATKLLAEAMGVAQSAIFDLASQGEISFQDLQEAFRKATEEGGMYEDGMAQQAETIKGAFSTLKDDVSQTLAEFGDEIVKTFDLKQVMKDVGAQLRGITEAFSNMSEESRNRLLKLIGVLAIGGPLLIGIGKLIQGVTAIVGAFKTMIAIIPKVIGWLSALKLAAASNPIIALATAVLSVGVAAFFLTGKTEEATKAQREFIDVVKDGQKTIQEASKAADDLTFEMKFEALQIGRRQIKENIREIEEQLGGAIEDFSAEEIANRLDFDVLKQFDEGALGIKRLKERANEMDTAIMQMQELNELRNQQAEQEKMFAKTGMSAFQRQQQDARAKKIAQLEKILGLTKKINNEEDKPPKAPKAPPTPVGVPSVKDSPTPSLMTGTFFNEIEKGQNVLSGIASAVQKTSAVYGKNLADMKASGAEFAGAAEASGATAINAWQKFKIDFMKVGGQFKQFMAEQMTSAISSFAQSVGQSMAGVGNEFKTGLEVILGIVADFAVQLGNMLIAMGSAILLLPGFQGPGAAYVAAGAALVALGTAGKAAINAKAQQREERQSDSRIPEMAHGGIVPPGFPNDTYPAMLSSGETVIPAPRPLPKGQTGMGTQNVNVSGQFRVKGTDLVLVLEKAKNTLR